MKISFCLITLNEEENLPRCLKSCADLADEIVVLDNGKILEQGSHAKLIKKGGTYAELWAHQSGGFIEE